MNQPTVAAAVAAAVAADPTPATACFQQVYLLEPDAGLLCRVLGLYAARALDVRHIDYGCADPVAMQLTVSVGDDTAQGSDVEASLRALVAKAATFVGVMAAVQQPQAARRGRAPQSAGA